MSVHSALLVTCLLGGLLINPPAALAQVPAPDSTAPARRDSEPAPTDSTPRAGSASAIDTTAKPATRDSARKADSSQAPHDSVGSGRTPGSTEPRDSILLAACRGSGSLAQDLLVIVFGPDAGKAERAAAARHVKGKLLGPVGPAEPGAYYLRVPSGGNEYRLRLASDQLILLPQVRQVGSRACPPPAPPQRTVPPSPPPQRI